MIEAGRARLRRRFRLELACYFPNLRTPLIALASLLALSRCVGMNPFLFRQERVNYIAETIL
jgi:hypothetical protein